MIVWADDLTVVGGSILAPGGFVETSAHNVQIFGTVETGAGGAWLVDPNNLRIGTGGDFAITTGANFVDTNNDNAFLTVATLQGFLNAGFTICSQGTQ